MGKSDKREWTDDSEPSDPEPFSRGYRRGVGCALEAWCGEFDSHIPDHIGGD